MNRVPESGERSELTSVSRRTFVGLVLGALGSLLAACGLGPAAPTEPASEAVAGAPSPTATSAPPTDKPALPTATAPATATRQPTAPADTPTPAALPGTATGTATSPPAPSTELPPTYTPVPPTPTSPPPPTATATASATAAPAAPPNPDRATLMAHWPAVATSRVVVVRHSGVWAGSGVPDPGIVARMLDAGLSTLADVADPLAVWRALFEPGERVLLKVNCIAYGGPTQPAVTYAVAGRLVDVGLRAEDILIFDRTDVELESAGYALNDGGPGVQCRGSRGQGTEVALSQARVRFYRELDDFDALINLPTPKAHGGAGISVSMKNHYGSVNRPGALHGGLCDPAIAELNAQPNIRDKTRLIVGAALNVSPNDWNRPVRENALLLSFDPVALDTVGRDILVRHRQSMGLETRSLVERVPQLQTAQTLQVGATDAALIDLREVVLA
jgi:hypothetical protein